MFRKRFGLKAAHEQFDPVTLLEHAKLAEKIGFDSIWASDHFHPWSHTGAQSAFAWTWLASVAESTKTLSVGTGVTAPILRYHPAIVAQAFATLGNMYPGRINLGLGTGEALNEAPLGFNWPSVKERLSMLEEAIKVIRALWKGDFVSFRGKYYSLVEAKMYTKTKAKIPIYIAAFGPKAAGLAGRAGDGLYTFMSKPPSYYKEVIFPALRNEARKANKDPEQLSSAAEMIFSYDQDLGKALQSARFWAGSLNPAFFREPVSDPREIERQGREISDEQVRQTYVITNQPEDIIKKARGCFEAGFDEIVFMSSSPNQIRAIEILGQQVLPHLSE
jgi:coenzyme F420-dependent glucose-6-phosphate dehydrogenase